MLPKSFFLIMTCFLFFLDCSQAGDQKEQVPYRIEEICGRKVYLSIPSGKVPEKGWPVVILLHGRGQTAGAWFGKGLLSRGGQKLFPALILNAGMVVVAPEALEPFGKGVKQWDFLHRNPEKSQDLSFFLKLYQWLDGNQNITFDISRIYIIGISSGGFMTSRLALAFPEKWEAVVVIAAGNADSFPQIPSFPIDNKPLSLEIAPQHPPTLIIHGDKDLIVPFAYGERYFQDLKKVGIKTDMIVIPESGHLWPSKYHEEMIQWLSSHQKASLNKEEYKDRDLDETFDGKSITLKTGDVFSVSLKGVPTAGYLWKIVEIDDTMLKNLDVEQKSLAERGLVGGSSLFTWRFRTNRKGKCSLVLKYFRPWEGAEKALKTFSLDLEVQ